MGQRFIIQHVNAARTALIESLWFDTGTVGGNVTGSWNSRTQTGEFAGSCQNIVTYSDGKMTECPTTVLSMADLNEGLYILYAKELGRHINFATLHVGDRLYLGRWDNHHSYIQITAKTSANGVCSVDMDYCTPDGVVAYQGINMTCQYGGSQWLYCGTLPWLWSYSSPGNYGLTRLELFSYYNQSTPYFINAFVYANPTSIENAEAFWNGVPVVDPSDPYSGGGYSGPGGGDPGKQNFGDVSDIVNPDALPDETQVGAVGCGLITIFSPDQSQLTRLAEMLWNKTFYDFLVNQFNGIEDLFVSLGVVPFTVTKGATVAISFMNFWEYLTPGPIPTNVLLTKAAKQWEEFNMGNVSLTGGDSSDAHTTDSVLDYSPYSKLGIYLPFIGYQELDIDECRGRTINLKYRVDILSGACLALISINGRTLYQFTGNCMTQLPLTSSDYSQIVSTATNVSIAAASAGTAGALASAGDALTSSRVEQGQISPQMGEYQNAQHAAQVSNAEGSLAGATANGLMGLKPSFKKTGAISGSTSIFGVMQPYLVLTTPKQSVPDGYNKVCGFPCNMGGNLGDFSGFTVVEDIRLNGLVATSPEVEEIYKLLKTGVII